LCFDGMTIKNALFIIAIAICFPSGLEAVQHLRFPQIEAGRQ